MTAVDSSLRKELLTQFLKAHRARINPSDVGLPEPSRRRGPGLRREDVATLTGVSVTWYTWLEQGRGIGVSNKVLERLCNVLKLEGVEREHLFALVQNRPAPIRSSEPMEPPQWLISMINSVNIPSLVMTFRWDVVAWNRLIANFRDWSKVAPERRNFLRILVTDPIYRKVPEEYEESIQRTTHRLRVDYGRAADDPELNELIQELVNLCPIFERYWHESAGVIGRGVGVNVIRNPKFNGLTFNHSMYIPEGEPHLRLVLFVPSDERCKRVIADLNEASSALEGVKRSD